MAISGNVQGWIIPRKDYNLHRIRRDYTPHTFKGEDIVRSCAIIQNMKRKNQGEILDRHI